MHARTVARIALALAPLTVSSLPAQTPARLTPEQGWSEIGQCAASASERARHACLDEVLRRAGLLTPQAEAKERRRQFGLDPNAPGAAKATTVPAPSPAPAPAAKSPVPKAQAAERVEVDVARAVMANDGKVVITTADGAIWKQTDSDTIPRLPAEGDRVNIRKASLGSYLCELPTHHTFRCIRTR